MRLILFVLTVSAAVPALADTQDYVKANVILVKSTVAYFDVGLKSGVAAGEPFDVYYDERVVASGKIAWSDENISKSEPLDSAIAAWMMFTEPLTARIRLFVAQSNRGGFLNIAYFSDLNLAPSGITLPDEMMIGRLIHRGLISRGSDGSFQPDLCGDYEIRDLTYTFYLRPDARFHSGRPLEASDVAYSLEQLASAPSLTNASSFVLEIRGAEEFRNQLVGEISGVFIIDNKTVAITLKRPFEAFEDYLAGPAGYIIPRPGEVATSIDGAGPYKIKWRNSDALALEAYVPSVYLDSLRFLRFSDVEEAGLSFEMGRLDMIPFLGEPPPKFITRGNYSSQNSPTNAYVILGINNDRSFQSGQALGKALAFLLDRSSLIRVILGGSASLPNCDITGQGQSLVDLYHEFIPDSAKFFFDTLPNRPKILNLGVDARFPVLTKVARYIEGQIQSKGIKVNESKMDMQWGYKNGSFLNLDLYVTCFLPACGKPDCLFYPLLSQQLSGQTGILFYEDEATETFLQNLRSETDAQKKDNLALGLIQSIVDGPPLVFVYRPYLTVIYRTDISGITADPAGYVDFRKTYLEPETR
jgi:ABC-type transport system substrate-binding protein